MVTICLDDCHSFDPDSYAASTPPFFLPNHHLIHIAAKLPAYAFTMWPFDVVDWLMLSVPIAYLVILVGSLSVFSNLYRKRQAASAASLEPWFPPHLQRNVYLTLLHMENPKVPDSILKAALLRRATEDIHRIVQVRNAKQALQVLLQRGSVGDDLWQRFQRAEKEIEEELRDVVQEVSSILSIHSCVRSVLT